MAQWINTVDTITDIVACVITALTFCACIIVRKYGSRPYYYKIITFQCLSSCFSWIFILVPNRIASDIDSPTCELLMVLHSYFFLGNTIWNVCFNFYLHKAFVEKARGVSEYEKRFGVISWGAPLVVSLILFICSFSQELAITKKQEIEFCYYTDSVVVTTVFFVPALFLVLVSAIWYYRSLFQTPMIQFPTRNSKPYTRFTKTFRRFNSIGFGSLCFAWIFAFLVSIVDEVSLEEIFLVFANLFFAVHSFTLLALFVMLEIFSFRLDSTNFSFMRKFMNYPPDNTLAAKLNFVAGMILIGREKMTNPQSCFYNIPDHVLLQIVAMINFKNKNNVRGKKRSIERSSISVNIGNIGGGIGVVGATMRYNTNNGDFNDANNGDNNNNNNNNNDDDDNNDKYGNGDSEDGEIEKWSTVNCARYILENIEEVNVEAEKGVRSYRKYLRKLILWPS